MARPARTREFPPHCHFHLTRLLTHLLQPWQALPRLLSAGLSQSTRLAATCLTRQAKQRKIGFANLLL
jgi:hypothetical protein